MKNKILIFLFTITLSLLMLTGCRNNKSTIINAYTSVYPTEYILQKLYGKNITIYSIYPDGTNYKDYKLSNKQISDYSMGKLFVYNSTIEKEKDYAVKLLNKNKDIKIIDATLGMNYKYDACETWLDPSNYLMMASNVKQGLKEYVTEKYEVKTTINNNYTKLKQDLSALDAELKEAAASSSNPTIVVSSDSFKFLEKYGFNVYSLQEGENLTDKNLSEIRNLMKNKTIEYIYMKNDEEESDTIKNLKDTYNIKIIKLNTLSTLNADDRKNKKDYMSIMEDNISSIRLETN